MSNMIVHISRPQLNPRDCKNLFKNHQDVIQDETDIQQHLMIMRQAP